MKFDEFVESTPKIKIDKDAELEFVEMANIIPGRRYVHSKKRKKISGGGSKFQNGDILFARITPCLEHGKIAQFVSASNKPAFGSTEFFVFRNRQGISDIGFVYYLCLTDTIRKPAERSMTGASGRQRANLESIKSLHLHVPDIRIQRKISSILSNYDNLIEINTCRIHLLEKMAKLIYDEWFVKFKFPEHEKVRIIDSKYGKIPEGWEMKKLSEIIEFKKGKQARNILEKTNENSMPYILIDGIKTGSHLYTDEKGVYVKRNDIIMVMDGASSGTVYTGQEGYIGSTFALIDIKDKTVSPYFLLLYLMSNFSRISSNNTGAAIPHANKDFIYGLNVILPNKEIREKLFNNFESLLKMKTNLELKNINLTKTRDLLLPKLISGEIDVSGLDIKIPGAET